MVIYLFWKKLDQSFQLIYFENMKKVVSSEIKLNKNKIYKLFFDKLIA